MAPIREPVLIAGGGIGGLAAALALAEAGFPAHVLERRPAFSEDGAGIQIGPNGTRILEKLGAGSLLRARVALPECLRVLDATTGHELTRLPIGRWLAERHGSPYWVAHRRDLHDALRTAAERNPRIAISTGIEIESADATASGIAALTADGQSLAGPALVAADGLWSNLRRGFGKNLEPRYTGKTALRTVIPIERIPDDLHRSSVHIWLAPGAHVVHYPVRAGHEVAVVVIIDEATASPGWSTPCDSALVMAQAANYPASLRNLLAAGEAWRQWSLHALPGLPAFAKGPIALLGDAAHPVLPFLAQGAVLALEDAATLAAELACTPADAAAAFARYAALRRPRAERVFAASRRNGRIYHLAGAAAWARNLALKTLPPPRLMAGYDWLYGFRPGDD